MYGKYKHVSTDQIAAYLIAIFREIVICILDNFPQKVRSSNSLAIYTHFAVRQVTCFAFQQSRGLGVDSYHECYTFTSSSFLVLVNSMMLQACFNN